MYIKKLKYTDKAEAIEDLIAKGICVEIDEQLTYGEGVHAIVEVGVIMNAQPTFDSEGNQLTPPTFYEGYHFDIMIENDVDFGVNEVVVNNPKHSFAGC